MILHFSQILFTDGFTFIVICPLFDIVSLVIFAEYTMFPRFCLVAEAKKIKYFFRDGQDEQPGSFESVGYTATR